MKIPVVAMVVGMALPALAYESLEALKSDHLARKVAAIEAYLAANPAAEDAADAKSQLVGDYVEAGRNDDAARLLREMYDAAIAAKVADDGRDLFVNIVMPLARIYQETGDRDGGKAFLDRVRTDVAGHEMEAEMGEVLDNLAGALNQPMVGDTLDFSITKLDGAALSLADLRGQVVLVDFWATWCGPCVKEIPHLKETYAAYREKGFEIVGISLDEDREQLDAFLEEHGIAWPIQFDGTGWESELVRKYGIEGIPTTYLLDKDGTIAAVDLRGDDLSKEVAKLLGL